MADRPPRKTKAVSASGFTKDKIDQIKKTFYSNSNVSETARLCKVSRNAVQKYCGTTDPETAEERSSRMTEIAKERELLRDVGGEKSFRSYLAKLVKDAARPMPAISCRVKPAKPVVNHTERFPLLSLNDWHFEEVVNDAAVMGLNSYGIPTACRRVWRIVDSCRAWKRDIEAGGRFLIPELTVALNGDFLTGTLHGLERHSSAPNVVRAALACGDLIALALRDLAEEFPSIRVVGTVGNHGRLPDDRKVPTKDPTRSWDYLAYGIAQRRLENVQHVRWILPEAYGVTYEVGGWQCYQAHGNFIPQSLGIVGYGIRRFTSALASNLAAAGKPLKYALFGHWHQSNSAEFAGLTTFISPSLIGTQEYTFLSGGSVNRAAQLLLVFDKSLGHVTTEVLYGDGHGTGGTYNLAV